VVADTVAYLRELGFSEYEARAYMALLQRSPLNGYELAKSSKLPRANIYAVLEKLVERGAVLRLDDPSGTRYAPVQPDELAQRLHRQFQSNLQAARNSLEKISAPAEHEFIWNMQGYSSLLENGRTLIDAALKDLAVALWPDQARALASHLAAAQDRGVAVTTLCLAGCTSECGNCRGRVYRYQVLPDQKTRWLVLVVDGGEVLAGEINAEATLAVRTRQRLLVDLTGWYIRNSIAIAAVLNDLGERLDRLIRPETRTVLESVGPAGSGNWLEHMRYLLGRPGHHPTEIGEP
jgi:DNA-binding MarR family transcriptional regulator